MATSFQERLLQMEAARNERISLLDAENELQEQKAAVLVTKVSSLRCAEQRRLLLERRLSEVEFRILSERRRAEEIDGRSDAAIQELRIVRAEIEELEQLEKERDQFYAGKLAEMREFQEMEATFKSHVHDEVQNLRISVAKLVSTLKDIQDGDKYSHNQEIAAAEARRDVLLSKKAKLDDLLASARQYRTLLRQQLQKMFLSQTT